MGVKIANNFRFHKCMTPYVIQIIKLKVQESNTCLFVVIVQPLFILRLRFLPSKPLYNRPHSRSYLRHICSAQEPLQTLASCNLVTFGEFCQHLRQVYPSFTSSNGEPISLKTTWLQSEASKSPRTQTGLYISLEL